MVSPRFSICQLRVQADALGEVHALGKTLDEPGDTDLVDHLGQLAGPRRAQQGDRPGIAVDDRLHGLEYLLLPAHHHGQDAVLGARLAAGDRAVEEVQAALPGDGIQLPGDFRRRRGVIHEHAAGLHAREDPVFADADGAHVVVVADTREDDVRIPGRLGGCRGRAPGKLPEPPCGCTRSPGGRRWPGARPCENP